MINICSTSLLRCSITGRKHLGKKWSNTSNQPAASFGQISRKSPAEKETSQSATSKKWLSNQPGGQPSLPKIKRSEAGNAPSVRFLLTTVNAVDYDLEQGK